MYPTGVSGPDPTKVMGRRVGAYLVDLVLYLIVLVVLFAALADQVTFDEAASRPDCDVVSQDFFDEEELQIECDDAFSLTVNDDVYLLEYGQFFLLLVVPPFLYYVVLQGLTGATLGKALFGIRVVRLDGRAPGIGRAFLRWLLLPFTLIELIAALVSDGNRRLGDKLGGTRVVAASAAGAPITPQGAGPYAVPYGSAPPPPPPSGGPQWDSARNAYIQWDPSLNRWMQWSDGEQRWKDIDT